MSAVMLLLCYLPMTMIIIKLAIVSPNDHDYYKISYCIIMYIQSHNCTSNIVCRSFLYESCVSIKFISSSSFFNKGRLEFVY